MKRPFDCSDAAYQTMLERLARVLSSVKTVVADDDTTIGAKSTTCNVGKCGQDDLKDGMYWKENHTCPLDLRAHQPGFIPGEDGNGCFYTCAVFQQKANLARCQDLFKKFMEKKK